MSEDQETLPWRCAEGDEPRVVTPGVSAPPWPFRARQRHHTPSLKPEQQRARTPSRTLPPQPHHQSLHLRRHLVRTRIRPRRRIRQPRQTPRRIPPEPSVNRLARHPEPQRHIRHRSTVAQHLQHRRMPLLHHTKLHQHDDPLPCDDQAATSEEGSAPPDAGHRGVTQHTYRSQRVKHVPGPHRSQCRPATGTASETCNTPTGANASSMYRDPGPHIRKSIGRSPLARRSPSRSVCSDLGFCW